MQRGGNFTIVPMALLIGLKIKVYEILQSSMQMYPLFSNQLPYNKILSQSKLRRKSYVRNV